MSLPADIIEKIVKYLPPKDQWNFALAAAESKTEESIGFSAVEIIRQVAKEQLSIPIDNLRAYRLIKSNNPHLWDSFVLEKIESDPFNLENVLSKILFLHGLHPENTCPLPTPHDLIPDIFYPELLKLFSRQWTQAERKIFLDDRFARVSDASFGSSYDRRKFKALVNDILLVLQPEDSHEVLFRLAYDALKAEQRKESNSICAATAIISHLVALWNSDECKKICELLPGMLQASWGAEYFNGAEIVKAFANAGKIDQDTAYKLKPILMGKFKDLYIADAMASLIKLLKPDDSDSFFIDLENNLLKLHTDEYAHAALHLLSRFPERMDPPRCLRLFEVIKEILTTPHWNRKDTKITTLALVAACATSWQKEQLDILFPLITTFKNSGYDDVMEQAHKTLSICFSDRYVESPVPELPGWLHLQLSLDYIQDREEIRTFLLEVSPDQRGQILDRMRRFFINPNRAPAAILMAIYLQAKDIDTVEEHSPVAAKIIRFIKHHYENANLRISGNTDTQLSNRMSIKS